MSLCVWSCVLSPTNNKVLCALCSPLSAERTSVPQSDNFHVEQVTVQSTDDGQKECILLTSALQVNILMIYILMNQILSLNSKSCLKAQVNRRYSFLGVRDCILPTFTICLLDASCLFMDASYIRKWLNAVSGTHLIKIQCKNTLGDCQLLFDRNITSTCSFQSANFN